MLPPSLQVRSTILSLFSPSTRPPQGFKAFIPYWQPYLLSITHLLYPNSDTAKIGIQYRANWSYPRHGD